MKIGTGWLGWTEVEVHNTSMPVIEAAYAGRIEMIRLMTGRPLPASSGSSPVLPPGATMSPELLMAMFGK